MPKWVVISSAVSLVVVSLWWIFFIFWKPGFVNLVQSIAYCFETPQLTRSVMVGATSRAYQYATVGSLQNTDIFFSANEVSHLLDVSRLYQPARLGLGIVATLSFIWLIVIVVKFKTLPKQILLVARNVQLTICVFALVALLFFPSSFLIFHRVLFPQGNWSFPVNSMLIQLFPESFWMLMMAAFLIVMAIFAFVFHLAARDSHE